MPGWPSASPHTQRSSAHCRIKRLSLPRASARLVAQVFAAYRRAGGLRVLPLPDFLIGASRSGGSPRASDSRPGSRHDVFPQRRASRAVAGRRRGRDRLDTPARRITVGAVKAMHLTSRHSDQFATYNSRSRPSPQRDTGAEHLRAARRPGREIEPAASPAAYLGILIGTSAGADEGNCATRSSGGTYEPAGPVDRDCRRPPLLPCTSGTPLHRFRVPCRDFMPHAMPDNRIPTPGRRRTSSR